MLIAELRSAYAMGKDRRGWLYQGQLVFAAKELDRNTPRTRPNDTGEEFDLGRVTDFTLWGLYISTTYRENYTTRVRDKC